jgi:integral membrane protein (TIGR01906 family)
VDKQKMKVIMRVVFIACLLSLPVVIVSCAVMAFSGSADLYRWGFQKYDISQRTGINNADLGKAGDAMAGYLTGRLITPQAHVNIDGATRLLYNSKELIHLEDVRLIVLLFRDLLIAFSILLVACGFVLYRLNGPGDLCRSIEWGSALTLGITVMLVTWALIDFDSLFYLFHIVSFSNDLWLLDPSKDYLIMLFPEGFFNDAAIFMVGSIMLTAVILLGATVILQKTIVARLPEKSR